MVDPWESVDLTLTSDSDEESSLAPDGEPVVTIARLRGAEELCGPPTKVLPSLAQRFTDIYSRKCSNISKRENSLESVFCQHQKKQQQSTKTPGDEPPERNFSVDSAISITTSNHASDAIERTKQSPTFHFNSWNAEKTRKQLFSYTMNAKVCEEEFIEIDDNSNDKLPNDPPDCVVVSPDIENCDSTKLCASQGPDEDVSTTGSEQWEEADIKYHYGEPPVTSPELHAEYLDTSTTAPFVIASLEPHVASQVPLVTSHLPHVTSPEPLLVDDEPLVDVPDLIEIESTAPQCDSIGQDEQAENETESVISISSDNESENCLVQSPHTFYCVYCEYSTIVGECYYKHIAVHPPGTESNLRMFCTECSYSTGAEKLLLFHMNKTHGIGNPLFYRSVDLRYICRICKLTEEFRTDIESHIEDRHKSQKHKAVNGTLPMKMISQYAEGTVPMKIIFQCTEDGCARYCKDRYRLYSHVVKHHKITPISYYEFLPQKGRPSKDARFGCFECAFKGTDRETVRLHAKKHHKETVRRHAKNHFTNDEGQNVDDASSTVDSVDLCEEIDLNDRNEKNQGASPGTHVTTQIPVLISHVPHVTSPNPHLESPGRHEHEPHVSSLGSDEIPPGSEVASPVHHIASPETQLTPVPHPTFHEPGFNHEKRPIGLPERDSIEENPSPPFNSHPDEDEIESEVDEISASDSDSDNLQGQPPRTFACIYCDYTTVVEEWYHKHIASHLSDAKPYFRMYCTECSYSTGSEKYLLFHMTTTHGIRNPEFYRSGEKLYTCRLCKYTQELRIGIESHIKEKHKQKNNVAKKKKVRDVEFKCSEDGCGKYIKTLGFLRVHVQKRHNIRFPLSYYEFSRQTGNLRLACFHCNKTIHSNAVKLHAREHYTTKQRRAPYLYKCPLKHADVKECTFSCKKRSGITEHYQSVHRMEVKYYKKLKFTYACLNCPTSNPDQTRMETHCSHYCKNG